MIAIVTGLIGTYPLAGMTFHYLQYMLGLRQLGWQVAYLEDTGQWFYQPEEATFTTDPGYNLNYVGEVMDRFGFGDAWTIRDPNDRSHGPAATRMSEIVRDADLFLNVSGSCWLRPEYRRCRTKIYVDTDPGYSQFKVAEYARGEGTEDARYSVERMAEHDYHATFAQNIGAQDCSIPTDMFHWIPTRQPIVLDLWQVSDAVEGAFSTILSWKPYLEPLRYGGMTFWGKERSLRGIIDLPRRSSASFELALAGDAPVAEFEQHGWRIRPALSVSRSTDEYVRFIRDSLGEVSVTKDVYSRSRSGWFSERSACYLASGRPVVLEDTGYSKWLPVGRGLHAFDDVDEASAAVQRVMNDYDREKQAARSIAERYFDAKVVLRDLLQATNL